MNAHTPGPWFAYHERLSVEGRHIPGRMPMVRLNGHIVAHIGRFMNHRTNPYVCNEAEANCRLISKAPDMVEYIMLRASEGDERAQVILDAIATAGEPADGNHYPDPDFPSNGGADDGGIKE